MIFTYTPEERAQLEAMDREELAAQEKLGAIWKRYEVGSKEAQAAKKEYQKGAAQRKAAFTSLLAQLEAARFSKLGTPAAILKDAEQQAQDAIVYIYVRIWKYTPEKDKQKGKHFIVDLASGGLYLYRNCPAARCLSEADRHELALRVRDYLDAMPAADVRRIAIARRAEDLAAKYQDLHMPVTGRRARREYG